MASRPVEVTLSVVCSSVEVHFSVLLSGEGDNCAAASDVTAAAAEKQQASGEAKNAFKDEEKTDSICIDPAALAEDYTALCAELQKTCEALSPSVPASAKPKVAVLSDVKLKTVCTLLAHVELASEGFCLRQMGACRLDLASRAGAKIWRPLSRKFVEMFLRRTKIFELP